MEPDSPPSWIHNGRRYKGTLYRCFYKEDVNLKIKVGKYIPKYSYVIYKGEKIGSTTIYLQLEESCDVPNELLEEALAFRLAEADAQEWLRMWNNYCDDFNDFNAGLPGESNVFSCNEVKERWLEMSQGEAFADMESRIFASQLLEE